MLGHVGDLDAQVAAALVHIELSGFEYRAHPGGSRIEVSENHVVFQQAIEVAIEKHQFLHLVYVVRVLFESEILRDQFEKGFFLAALKYLTNPVYPERLHRASFLGGKPGRIRGEPIRHFFPFVLIHRGLALLEDEGAESVEASLPCRIHLVKGKSSGLIRTCERALPYFRDVIDVHGHPLGGGLVVAQQTAALEKVGHLLPYRLIRGKCGRRIVSIRLHAGIYP